MLIGVRVRTTMISTVYRKMLKLNEKSRQVTLFFVSPLHSCARTYY